MSNISYPSNSRPAWCHRAWRISKNWIKKKVNARAMEKSKSSLKQHIKKHTGEKCIIAISVKLKQQKQAAWRLRHKQKHSGEKPHRCEYSCITTDNLKGHMMMIDIGEKPFKCNQCNQAFAFTRNWQQHMRTHTEERTFKCSQCDKTFKSKRELARESINH